MKKWFWGTVTTAFLLLILLQITPQEFVYKHFVAGRSSADITDLVGYTGNVGQEDINFGSGLATDTFTIVGYNGATVTLTKVPAFAANIASIIKGKWYVEQKAGDQCDSTLEGSVAWVATTLNGDEAAIELPGNYSYNCGTSYEIPSNLSVNYQRGAIWDIDNGITLTHSGYIDAGSYKIFSGAGSVISSSSSTNAVFDSTWWGVSPSATSTINADGLNKSIDFFAALNGGTVTANPGTYATDDTVTVDAGVILKGYSAETFATARTAIKPDTGVTTAIYRVMTGNNFGFGLENIQVDMDNMAAGSKGIDVVSDRHFSIKNVSVYNLNFATSKALAIRSSVAGGVYYGLVENFIARDGSQVGIGISLEGVSTDITHISFNRTTLANLYDGIVADNCGTGIVFTSLQDTTNANNGITVTNQSSNTSILVVGGEIGGHTGTGVNGRVWLSNVKMSGNGTDLANGADRMHQATVSGEGLITTTGSFRANVLGVEQSGIQKLTAADTIDPIEYGIVLVAGTGGATTLTDANPIDTPLFSSPFCLVVGTSNTDTVILNSGANLKLNESTWTGGLYDNLFLFWNSSGSHWQEISRSNPSSIQAGAYPPATCTVGQIFLDTDETVDTNCATTADNSLCLCVAANTWAALENN